MSPSQHLTVAPLADVVLESIVRAALREDPGRVGDLTKASWWACRRRKIEVDTPGQLREALAVGVDAVLLDNMSISELGSAVDLAARRR